MNLITFEESHLQRLAEDISFIRQHLTNEASEANAYDELWLNNHEVCQYLHISEKTLWRLRKNGELTYAKLCGQYFYKLGDIRYLLELNIIESTETYLNNLVEQAQNYANKGRDITKDR